MFCCTLVLNGKSEGISSRETIENHKVYVSHGKSIRHNVHFRLFIIKLGHLLIRYWATFCVEHKQLCIGLRQQRIQKWLFSMSSLYFIRLRLDGWVFVYFISINKTERLNNNQSIQFESHRFRWFDKINWNCIEGGKFCANKIKLAIATRPRCTFALHRNINHLVKQFK